MAKIIGIIGLGYVGLPLAVEFSKKYKTIGYDVDNKRISDLNLGIDKNLEISSAKLRSCNNLILTNSIDDLGKCNIFIVTVPTPVDKQNKPDMNCIYSASKNVAQLLKKNDIVIYESTVYPGATEEYCVPILEKFSSLTYKKDFFCGYSPERINPGDKNHILTKIIKITSGSDDKTLKVIDKLYSSIIPAGTYKASSIRIAESAKVIENIQRDVNIALINEFSIIFSKLGLNTEEILNAAGTKWNFLPFKPGLVGGHCIGVDPYYLTHKAIEIGYNPEMILAGRRINDNMSNFIVDRIITEISNFKLNPINLKIGIFGLTFKENCPDLRNTQVKYIIERLSSFNYDIYICDSIADADEVKEYFNIHLTPIDQVKQIDVAIIPVNHDYFKTMQINDWLKKFKNKKGILFDIKSIYSKDYFKQTNVSYLNL